VRWQGEGAPGCSPPQAPASAPAAGPPAAPRPACRPPTRHERYGKQVCEGAARQGLELRVRQDLRHGECVCVGGGGEGGRAGRARGGGQALEVWVAVSPTRVHLRKQQRCAAHGELVTNFINKQTHDAAPSPTWGTRGSSHHEMRHTGWEVSRRASASVTGVVKCMDLGLPGGCFTSSSTKQASCAEGGAGGGGGHLKPQEERAPWQGAWGDKGRDRGRKSATQIYAMRMQGGLKN
jgi:hypothetical protein